MTNSFFTAMTIAILLAMPLAHSADQADKYAIRGAGLLPCASFTEERARKSPAYMMIGGWMDGYISASNKLQADTYDVSPFETTELLAVLIGRHCADHPDDTLAPIMDSLLTKLHKNRLKKASPFLSVEVGKLQTRLYARTIKNIQTKLSQKSLFNGTINGLWSDDTSAALAHYQKNIKFDPTGFPDQKTLWYLFRSKK